MDRVTAVIDAFQAECSITAKIKPLNLIALLREFYQARVWKTRVACVIRLLEMYDVYWKPVGELGTAIVECLVSGIASLPKIYDDFRKFLSHIFKGQTQEIVEERLENQADGPTPFVRLCNLLGFNPDDCGPIVHGVLSIIAPIILIVAGLFGFNSNLGDRLSKSIVHAGNTLRAGNTIGDNISRLFSTIRSSTAAFFGVDPLEGTRKGVLFKKIDALTKEVDDKRKRLTESPGEALDEVGFIEDIHKSLNEVQDILAEVARQDSNMASLRNSVDSLVEKARALEEAHDKLRASVVGKLHPTVVWLYGKPGVGKSHMCEAIVNGLSQQLRRPVTSYIRTTTDSYWSSYAGQDVVIYDDFGADKDNVDHAELDQIYTGNVTMLNMAAVEDKGKSRFTSPFVILCSNLPYIDKSCKLTDPSILERRRDLLFEVVDEEACAIRARGEVIPDTHYNSDYSHLTIRRLNPHVANGTCEFMGEIWQIGAIPERMLELYEQRKARHVERVAEKLRALNSGIVEEAVVPLPCRIIKVDRDLAQPQAAPPPRVDATRQAAVARGANILNAWLARDPSRMQNQANRPPIILLLGEPGTGKTMILDSADDKYKKFDEFTHDDEVFKAVFSLVWDTYAGHASSPLLMSCNPVRLRAQITKHFDAQQVDAFLRRCTVFEFVFKQPFFGKKKGPGDVRASGVDSAVDIYQYENSECVDKPYYRNVLRYINKAETGEVPLVATTLPTITEVPETTHIIQIGATFLGSQTNLPSYRVFKGGLLEVAPLFLEIQAIIKSRHFDSAQDALLDFNDRRFRSPYSALLKFTDTTIVILSLEGCLVAHLFNGSDERVTEKLALAVTDGLGVYLTAFESLLKTILGLYFVSSNWERSSLYDEGWGDLEYDIPPSQHDWPVKLPKGAVEEHGARASMEREYCPAHKRMDYCLALSSESARVKRVYSHEASVAFAEKHLPLGEEGDTPTFFEKSTRVTRNKFSAPRSERKKVLEEVMSSEAICDPAALEVANIIAANTVWVGSQEKPLCRAIMTHDHIGVTNAHIYNDVEGGYISIVHQNVKYAASVLKVFRKRDLLVFSLPKQAPSFRDIRKHMVPRADIKSVEHNQAILVTPQPSGHTVHKVLFLEDMVEKDVSYTRRYGISYHGHMTGLLYEPILTVNGDCGSAIVLLNPSRARKFIGFHNAANTTTGFGTIITVEDVEDLQSESAEPIKILKHQAILPSASAEKFLEFTVFGTCHDGEQPIQQYHPGKTRLYRSPFAGFFDEELYEPAALSNCDTRLPETFTSERDIYQDAISKWSREQPEIDMDVLNTATSAVAEHLANVVFDAHYPMWVMTKTEAINGTSRIPTSNPIYRHSSAGYPFKHWPGVVQKTPFFTQDATSLLWSISMSHPLGVRLNQAVDDIINEARQGQRVAVVFAGNLKDEPVKKKKIYLEPRTRSFAGSPIDYTLAHRMYFHTANAALSALHNKIPVKVGIDPSSLSWNDLYHYHARVSTEGFDVDFSEWDARVPLEFTRAVVKVYDRIYQVNDPNYCSEHATIRNALHSALHGPLVTFYDTVLQCPGGQVSGQPATSMDNCIINMILQYYIWRRLCVEHGKFHLLSYTSFIEHVASSVYGDDNMVTVSVEAQTFFNLENYARECNQLGMVVTDSTKSGELRMKKLSDMTFLKRQFIKHGPIWVGALLDEVFNKMLGIAACKKDHDFFLEPNKVAFDGETILATAECALREASLKGRDFYNRLATHLRKCCREWSIRGFNPPPHQEVFNAVIYKTSSTWEGFRECKEQDGFNDECSTSCSDSKWIGIRQWDRFRLNGGSRDVNIGNSGASGTRRSSGKDRSSEHVRPVYVSAVDNCSDVHMVNQSTGGNAAVVCPNTSQVLEPLHIVHFGDIQHVGGGVRLSRKNCGYRLPCGITRSCAIAPKQTPSLNNIGYGCNILRVGVHRSQATRGCVTRAHRSKEHRLPLYGLRRDQSPKLRRLVCSICTASPEHVIVGCESDQCANRLSRRPIVHNVTGCTTSGGWGSPNYTRWININFPQTEGVVSVISDYNTIAHTEGTRINTNHPRSWSVRNGQLCWGDPIRSGGPVVRGGFGTPRLTQAGTLQALKSVEHNRHGGLLATSFFGSEEWVQFRSLLRRADGHRHFDASMYPGTTGHSAGCQNEHARWGYNLSCSERVYQYQPERVSSNNSGNGDPSVGASGARVDCCVGNEVGESSEFRCNQLHLCPTHVCSICPSNDGQGAYNQWTGLPFQFGGHRVWPADSYLQALLQWLDDDDSVRIDSVQLEQLRAYTSWACSGYVAHPHKCGIQEKRASCESCERRRSSFFQYGLGTLMRKWQQLVPLSLEGSLPLDQKLSIIPFLLLLAVKMQKIIWSCSENFRPTSNSSPKTCMPNRVMTEPMHTSLQDFRPTWGTPLQELERWRLLKVEQPNIIKEPIHIPPKFQEIQPARPIQAPLVKQLLDGETSLARECNWLKVSRIHRDIKRFSECRANGTLRLLFTKSAWRRSLLQGNSEFCEYCGESDTCHYLERLQRSRRTILPESDRHSIRRTCRTSRFPVQEDTSMGSLQRGHCGDTPRSVFNQYLLHFKQTDRIRFLPARRDRRRELWEMLGTTHSFNVQRSDPFFGIVFPWLRTCAHFLHHNPCCSTHCYIGYEQWQSDCPHTTSKRGAATWTPIPRDPATGLIDESYFETYPLGYRAGFSFEAEIEDLD